MKIRIVFWLVLINFLFIPPLHAVENPSELLNNTQQEKIAESIGQQLRCLVCQNESIEDSNAPLAQDLRRIVRDQITHGKKPKEIIEWMTKRYGNFIRLKPVFNTETALLWLMPFLALGGAFMLARRLWIQPSNQQLTPSGKD